MTKQNQKTLKTEDKKKWS